MTRIHTENGGLNRKLVVRFSSKTSDRGDEFKDLQITNDCINCRGKTRICCDEEL